MPKISRMVRDRNTEGVAAREADRKMREGVRLAMLQVLVRRELNAEKLRRTA